MNDVQRILMAGAAVGALFSGAASAADLLPPPEPVMPLPQEEVFSWTGLYIGGHGGFAWGDEDADGEICDKSSPPGICDGVDLEGWLAGIQFGYNYQAASNLVGGIEADLSFAEIEGSWTAGTGTPTFFEDEIDLAGTLRARLGFALDRFLPYVTGGLAWGHFSSEGAKTSGSGQVSTEEVLFGWAAGGGLEWSPFDRWSVKGEYLFLQYMDINVATKEGKDYVTDSIDAHTARFGINYHF